VEKLGIFGITWQEKVAKRMHDTMPEEYRSEIKSWKTYFQPSGLNVTLVDTLYDFYLSNGAKNISSGKLSELSGVTEGVCLSFLESLKYLATQGYIDYKIYDITPSKESEKLKEKIFDNEASSVLSKVGNVTNGILLVLCVGTLLMFSSKLGSNK
jgi:hypothetical protein